MRGLKLDTVRAYRWPIVMALVLVSGVSWCVWLWQRGVIPLPTANAQLDDNQRSTLQQLQDKNNALEVEVQQLRNGKSVDSSATTATNVAVKAGASSSVNINSAVQADLETLPGIGPSKAAAIIAYREAHGAFATIHDITLVKGIGDSTFEALKLFITVENH